MPALDQKIVDDLFERLKTFLKSLGGYGEPKFLNSGGSAAVFEVECGMGLRAFKAFNPEFLNGPGGEAERRRLEIQRRLIGHHCPSLVQTYRVQEAEGTAFLEMEFVPWPQLTTQLASIPDESVIPLITQLVNAVKFLDENNIVHRDIKPENIHVSPDFANLKLLDLGVARELVILDGEEAAVTDHGNLRPFLATAQYSSPEYLFRLDEPSPKLWKGLNFYQLGAVLHDLIMKQALFQHEMGLGNRWLVAKAVLTKVPSFVDGNPERLAKLKALSARCLVKDLDTRVQLVGWEDFILEGAKDPLTDLRARLAKRCLNAGGQSNAAAASRLEFDRNEYVRRLIDRVRFELLPTCGTNLPLSVKPSVPGEPPHARFTLTIDKQLAINCVLHFAWQEQLYDRTANVLLEARILCNGYEEPAGSPNSNVVSVAVISENEVESAVNVANAIAHIVGIALDLIEATDDPTKLHGTDLQQQGQTGESE
ncbi:MULTISPECIES: protein kinase domain-containing protein [Chromobacterium]|uniref:protein kinase domain-containing protein n=1 Tax=Chromobacterium TaxID=535 RepID=UPI0006416E21|nr:MULTISPECIES: protein kinase [Chromobacterium]OQS35417.1 serine/threonine protein kinase [Chromobacterium haemolyticum]